MLNCLLEFSKKSLSISAGTLKSQEILNVFRIHFIETWIPALSMQKLENYQRRLFLIENKAYMEL
jgi:hypothetical protein